jgi:hypothetical protein
MCGAKSAGEKWLVSAARGGLHIYGLLVAAHRGAHQTDRADAQQGCSQVDGKAYSLVHGALCLPSWE